MAHRAQQASSLRRRNRRRRFLARCGEPVENSRHGSSSSGTSRQQRGAAEDLIGAAPADMIDQDLRRRQQDQHAGAGRGIDHGHRGRQPRAEPAAEQDRVRNVADQRDAEADAKPEAQLELPEMLRVGRDQERAAEQQQPERIDGARPGAVEQAADQRRGQSARQRRPANRPRPPARGPSRSSPRSASGKR